MAITQRDVAERAGVSRPLVSLVMRNSPHVSESKRQAVLQAASELGYRRNAHAAQLASHKSMILGVVLTEMLNPTFPEILRVVEDCAEEAGYGVLLTVGTMNPALERQAVNRLLGHRVDGILFAGSRLPTREMRELAMIVPVVSIGRQVPGLESVLIDDRAGARLAVEHLVSLGHERITHVDGGGGPGSRQRRAGFLATMKALGHVDSAAVVPGDYTESGGAAAALEILSAADRRPTAIFAANDLSAIGVMGVAKQVELTVPSDLSIVGFDDTAMSGFGLVRLTTVHQTADNLAATAVTALIGRIQDPERPANVSLLEPKLVIRSSTSPPTR